MLMRPWPAAAISTASFEGDDERLNRVKRIFIKAERDHMLNPEQQDSMIKKWPPSEVLVIDTDQSLLLAYIGSKKSRQHILNIPEPLSDLKAHLMWMVILRK